MKNIKKYVHNSTKSGTHNCNCVPPHTPPIRKKIFSGLMILIILLSVINTKDVKCQELPDLEELENSLSNYYLKKMSYELQEFKYKSKGKWTRYLPSIGVSPILSSGSGIRFGPSMSYSFTELFDIGNRKRAKKAKVESIIKRNELEYNEALQRLRIDYRKIEIRKESTETKETLLALERKKFEIYKDGFNKKKVSPLQLYEAELAYMRFVGDFNLELEKIGVEVLEIMKRSRYNLENKKLLIENKDNNLAKIEE